MGIIQHDWSLHRQGPSDQARHAAKIREAIQKNLPEIVAEEAIITHDGKKRIRVPIRSLEEYHFRYNAKGQEHVGQGPGGSKKGQVIGKDPAGTDGAGQGQKPSDQPGEDVFEVDLSIDDLAELIFRDLELPGLKPKLTSTLHTEDVVFEDRRKSGVLANLDKKRTLLESLRRNARQGQPQFLATPDDLRFKTWNETTKPRTNAVVIAMRDVSGSMGEMKKYFFVWGNREERKSAQPTNLR